MTGILLHRNVLVLGLNLDLVLGLGFVLGIWFRFRVDVGLVLLLILLAWMPVTRYLRRSIFDDGAMVWFRITFWVLLILVLLLILIDPGAHRETIYQDDWHLILS